MIKVSVIVPIYNAEKYLERTIGSLLSQTIDNYEILLINDGSTDGSKEIIKYYEESFIFIGYSAYGCLHPTA